MYIIDDGWCVNITYEYDCDLSWVKKSTILLFYLSALNIIDGIRLLNVKSISKKKISTKNITGKNNFTQNCLFLS